MMKRLCFSVAIFSLFTVSMLAQADIQVLPPSGGGDYQFEPRGKCLSDEERENIWEELRVNMARLDAEGKLPTANTRSIVNFDWPVRAVQDLEFDSYYGISNFVDQQMSTGTLDYNCNARTYDGHLGTDIFTWPFPWYLYSNDMVEVIAGEAGVIINKLDGYDDDHCSCFGTWNAVYLRHSDGSIAWYGHLKRGTLTSKSIGQTVEKGEYLGVVASSGCSTGPHLHLEVYDSQGDLIDPYQGSCNSLNNESWWATQKDYREPNVNAVLTHDQAPNHGCPADVILEETHFANEFIPGQTLFTGFYFRDQIIGARSVHRIIRPDNTVWQSWIFNSPNSYNASWWYWSWNLPLSGPFGTWKVEVDFNGTTTQHSFSYSLPTSITQIGKEDNELALWPNPANAGTVTIKGEGFDNAKVKIYDTSGRLLQASRLTGKAIDISNLTTGLYFVAVNNGEEVFSERLVVR